MKNSYKIIYRVFCIIQVSTSSTIHRKYQPCESELENDFPGVLGKKSPSFDSSSYYIPPLSRKHVHFNRDTDESLNSSEYGYQTGGLNHRHNWHY